MGPWTKFCQENFFKTFRISDSVETIPLWLGRDATLQMGSPLVARLSLEISGIENRFDVLRVRVVNKTLGEVDRKEFRFHEYTQGGLHLHVFQTDGMPSWRPGKPLGLDKMLSQVERYLQAMSP